MQSEFICILKDEINTTALFMNKNAFEIQAKFPKDFPMIYKEANAPKLHTHTRTHTLFEKGEQC